MTVPDLAVARLLAAIAALVDTEIKGPPRSAAHALRAVVEEGAPVVGAGAVVGGPAVAGAGAVFSCIAVACASTVNNTAASL